ncbi:MAG: hypothetical protein SF123_23150 [Chloroflexota bacterium]|nr:hypothetical protein [Chloroflexota bacterium]
MAQTVAFAQRLGIGNPSRNPYALITLVLMVVCIIAMLTLMILIFTSTSAQTRLDYVLWLFGLLMLGSIPVVLFLTFSRRYEYMLHIVHHAHWAHWHYNDQETERWRDLLPRAVKSVYLSPDGVVWEKRHGHHLIDFRSGLRAARLIEAHEALPPLLEFEYFFNRRSRYGFILWKEKKHLQVPIPLEHEAEAQVIVSSYQRILGRPSELLSDSWRLALLYGAFAVVVLLPMLLLMLPLSSASIAEEFDIRATAAAVSREADLEAAQAAFALVESQLNVIYQASRQSQATGWQQDHPYNMGFSASTNLLDIYTGRCPLDGQVYIYAFERNRTVTYSSDPTAFIRTDAELPDFNDCVPPRFDFVYSWQTMSDEWLYGFLQRDNSDLLTAIAPYFSLTPTPAR